jgi:hypothetical protein
MLGTSLPLKASRKVLLPMLRVVVLSLIAASLPARGVETGVGVGWHDPHDTEIGLKSFFLWNHFGIGLGVGSVAASGNKHSSGLNLQGDVNFMWLVAQATFRPFLRLGLETGGSASSNSKSNVQIGAGEPFGGAGLLLVGSKVFGWVGADLDDAAGVVPFAGIGLKL